MKETVLNQFCSKNDIENILIEALKTKDNYLFMHTRTDKSCMRIYFMVHLSSNERIASEV